MLAQNGALADLIAAGARILESACGPCIGMGQSPNTNGVSLRTFNRNFEGRSGTASGQVYLVSPETAAVSALTGVFTNPQTLGEKVDIAQPEHFLINDNMVEPPAPVEEMDKVEVVYGIFSKRCLLINNIVNKPRKNLEVLIFLYLYS